MLLLDRNELNVLSWCREFSRFLVAEPAPVKDLQLTHFKNDPSRSIEISWSTVGLGNYTSVSSNEYLEADDGESSFATVIKNLF